MSVSRGCSIASAGRRSNRPVRNKHNGRPRDEFRRHRPARFDPRRRACSAYVVSTAAESLRRSACSRWNHRDLPRRSAASPAQDPDSAEDAGSTRRRPSRSRSPGTPATVWLRCCAPLAASALHRSPSAGLVTQGDRPAPRPAHLARNVQGRGAGPGSPDAHQLRVHAPGWSAHFRNGVGALAVSPRSLIARTMTS
jgi:hypothetical protein